MRFLAPWLGVFFFGITLLHAQVRVEIVLEQDQFLRDESLPVMVKITNRSGQPLHLGQEGWLTFNVASRDGLRVAQRGEPEINRPFELASSATETRRVDLMPYYDLSRSGRYEVTVTLHIHDWNQEVVGKTKRFDIGQGSKQWEQEFGVPGAAGPPEVRKYALVQANYLGRPTLYLRLTDLSENMVYRVFPIGPLLSFSRPERLIDGQSNLHVLFQTGARSFNYSVINPEGRLIARQTHYYFRSRPTLRGEDGKIGVDGGARQIHNDDIPAPAAAKSTGDVKPTPP